MDKIEFPLIESRPVLAQTEECYDSSGNLLPECPVLGWSRFDRASAHLGPHAHSGCFEICYIVRGSVEWWAGSQIFQVGPRDVYVTRPNETHGGVDAFMHPCELYWLHVRPNNHFYRRLNELSHRHFAGGPILASHFERLLAEHRYSSGSAAKGKPRIKEECVTAARAALRLLVLDTLRFYEVALQQAEQRTAPSPPIEAAMQWIHRHFQDPKCLEHAMKTAGLGGTQFRKRFQAETGFAPHDYLLRAQVQEAKRRLTRGRESITEIAFELGFSSSQYFATVFRKHVGLTPQTYRRYHASAD